MPQYAFVCSCGNEEIDILPFEESEKVRKCSRCKCVMIKKISFGVVADIFPAEGIHLEHVCPDGKTFYSKQEMRQFEDKNGMTIGMLH